MANTETTAVAAEYDAKPIGSAYPGTKTFIDAALADVSSGEYRLREDRKPNVLETGALTGSQYQGTPVLKHSRREAARPMAIPAGRRSLDGNVLEIDEVTVNCELYDGNRLKEIQLPRSLFPENVHYGMAITVALDETGGTRRLVVQEREPNAERLREGLDEFNRLIERL
ncbi:MAG: hypothetical protein LPK58_05590 [Gammaproteobacteria bacterium]|nr:hypothetical protein [Gammaproteobacteria bacterium]MDX5375114.1 hypothetical protein [Gammaproteobacteria bacterium]